MLWSVILGLENVRSHGYMQLTENTARCGRGKRLVYGFARCIRDESSLSESEKKA